MYYYQDHHLYQYYAKYGDTLFKTRDEYLDWVRANNLKLEKVAYFRLSKRARKVSDYPEGAWVEYEVVPGTYLYDERDFSHYEFPNEEEAMEMADSYRDYPDGHASQTVFEGVPGEGDSLAYTEPDRPIEPFDPQRTILSAERPGWTRTNCRYAILNLSLRRPGFILSRRIGRSTNICAIRR